LSPTTRKRIPADARRLRLIEVINTMSRSVAIEMDLRLEAAANVRDGGEYA